MSQYYIIVDGVVYRGIRVISVKRSFSVTDGDNVGRKRISGEMVRDIIGTFYNYEFTIDSKNAAPDVYDRFYEVISAPEESHIVVVPYGRGTMTYEAYTTAGDDTFSFTDSGNRWKNLTFSFIAMRPQRTPS